MATRPNATDQFDPEQIYQIIEEYLSVVGRKQYIGARYVPIFGRVGEDSIEWDNTAPYEPLTIVLYQGNSYTSRQYVPTGVDITNEEFWACTGNYNAQVEAYRREVLGYSEEVQQYLSKIAELEDKIQTKRSYPQSLMQRVLVSTKAPANYIVQGTCVFDRDGIKMVECFHVADGNTNVIRMYDVEEQRLIREVNNTTYGHVNDITYDSKRDRLVIAGSGIGDNWPIYILNARTLDLVDTITPTVNLTNICYDKDNDCYWGKVGDKFYKLDDMFVVLDSVTFEGITASQGVEYYDGKLFSFMGYRNKITVYSLDGNITDIISANISPRAESEALSIVNGVIYTSFLVGTNASSDHVMFYSDLMQQEAFLNIYSPYIGPIESFSTLSVADQDYFFGGYTSINAALLNIANNNYVNLAIGEGTYNVPVLHNSGYDVIRLNCAAETTLNLQTSTLYFNGTLEINNATITTDLTCDYCTNLIFKNCTFTKALNVSNSTVEFITCSFTGAYNTTFNTCVIKFNGAQSVDSSRNVFTNQNESNVINTYNFGAPTDGKILNPLLSLFRKFEADVTFTVNDSAVTTSLKMHTDNNSANGYLRGDRTFWADASHRYTVALLLTAGDSGKSRNYNSNCSKAFDPFNTSNVYAVTYTNLKGIA